MLDGGDAIALTIDGLFEMTRSRVNGYSIDAALTKTYSIVSKEY